MFFYFMPEETKLNNGQADVSNDDFQKLLDLDNAKIPQAGEIIKGTVISASKAEVKLDIDGITTGVVRGRELYFEAEEYANLKPGDEVEATIIEEEMKTVKWSCRLGAPASKKPGALCLTLWKIERF